MEIATRKGNQSLKYVKILTVNIGHTDNVCFSSSKIPAALTISETLKYGFNLSQFYSMTKNSMEDDY